MQYPRLILPVVALCLPALAPVSYATDAFTVVDSIELTRIVDPARTSLYESTGDVQRSPDGEHFFVVTQKGDLSTDTLRYELLLFNVAEVLSFIADEDATETVSPRKLVAFDASAITGGAKSGGIEQARWLPDSRTIAFIGGPLGTPVQVMSIDIRDGALRSLTAHPTTVRRFAISSDAERLVYTARNGLPDWRERNRKGYAVSPENSVHFYKLQPNHVNTFSGESLYFLDYSRDTPAPQRIAAASGKLDLYGGIWISPSGRWAITLTYAPDVPAAWLSQYEVMRRIGSAMKEADDNPTSPPGRSLFRRFVLIDTLAGSVSDVLRSPISWGGHDVHWSRDEQKVILGNTHLPLEGVDQPTLLMRQTTSSVVEFHLEHHKTTPIGHFPAGSAGGQIIRTDRPEEDLVVVKYVEPGDDTPHFVSYRRTDTGSWIVTEDSLETGGSHRLRVSVRQDMNTPPDVYATDRSTNRSRAITRLNPRLNDRRLGRVERIEWTDSNGRIWQGGLMYPPTYDRTRRYPLVIQTYGFSEQEFVVDGPLGITSAYAARPLVNHDILVLQMGSPVEKPFSPGNPSEGPNYVAGFEGAVQALDQLGVIDPTRVGLIGFSRTGLHVSYAVAFSSVRFAAATIADSASAGYLMHIYSYGQPIPGMMADESMIGTRFWGEDREVWLRNSPNFNAHRINTPLRIEHYGVKTNFYWDMFALLTRNRRPVEMIHIPLAHHVLKRPQARLTSQQGNVDWFTFWLKDYEDPDPAKAEQYQRWRKLRADHLRATREDNDSDPSAPLARYPFETCPCSQTRYCRQPSH